MATVKLSQTSGEKKGEVPPFFNERATLRFKDVKFGLSQSSGRKQLTLEAEIVAPLEVEIGGVKYRDLDKNSLKFYVSTEDKDLFKLSELHSKLGLPDEIDPENPNVETYKGVVFEYLLQSRERKVQKKDSEGHYYKPAQFVMGGDGKPISQGWEWGTNIEGVLGLGNAEVNPLA